MIFDCWATLWRPSDIPISKEFQRLTKDLKDVELQMTLHQLEPVVRAAVAETNAKLLKFNAGFTWFNGAANVAAVHFQIEATDDIAARVLNIIRKSGDRPTLKVKNIV